MSERVIGWICDEEWLCTYQKLFCGNMEDQYDALDIINLWRARFCGKIPVAIDATSRLLESWLEGNKVTCDAKRQLMSAAITQFVGLVTERGLKGNTKKPIHEVGEDYGIPEWLINLRHEMAHGPLPTLQMLEKAIVFALDWLKDNHWDVQYGIAIQNKKVQLQQSSEFVVLNGGEEMVLKLLLDYVSVMTKKHVNITASKRKKKACAVVRNLEVCIQDDLIAKSLCSFLVERKFLVTHPRHLLHKSSPENVSNIQCFNFWKPILELIRNKQHMSVLLCRLVGAVCENDHGTLYHGLFYSWAKHVLNKVESKTFIENRNKEHYSEWMVTTAKLSLEKCECCQHLKEILKDKLPDLVNSDKAFLIAQLVNGSTKLFDNSPNETQPLCTYKLEDIRRPKSSTKPVNTRTSIQSGPWKVYDGEPLLQIGLLPGQAVTALYESVFGTFSSVSNSASNDQCFNDSMTTSGDITNTTESAMEVPTSSNGLASFIEKDWICLEKMINSQQL